MAIPSTRIIILSAIVFSSLAIILSTTMVSAECDGFQQGLVDQCAMYVLKLGPLMKPSSGCCGVIKDIDLACVCQHITPEVENVISMEKAAYVAKECGKPLDHGTRCGSYVVP